MELCTSKPGWGVYEVPPPGPGMGDTTSLHRISQMRLQCCGSPLPTATLGKCRRCWAVPSSPPEGLLPFLDGESAHVRVWNLDPASSSLLSSHQPRLDCPRPPSRRGASPLLQLGSSQAQQHGYIQIYFAPASATPSTLHTLSLQSPLRPLCAMDSAQLSLQGTFLPVTASRQEEPCSQNIPWLHRHQPLRPSSTM